MTELEHNLAETFGAAAPYSDYRIGESIRYRVPGGTIYTGSILWIASAGESGLSGNDDLPLRYIVSRDGWTGFPDVVYSSDVITQEPDEPVLVKCKFCSGHHYRGQEMYCPFNPDRGESHA